MHLVLFVKGAHRLSARDLSPRGMYGLQWHMLIDGAYRGRDHLAALIGLVHNAISFVPPVSFDSAPRPRFRRQAPAAILDHIAMITRINASDNNSGFVAPLRRLHGGVNRHNNALQ